MWKYLSTIKDSERERQLFTRRAIVLGFGLSLLLIGLVARLVYLQVVQHHEYSVLARQNQLNLLPSEPNRGLIYDRNGVILAENIPVFALVITPSLVPHLKETLQGLRGIIAISDEDLEQFYRQLRFHRKFEAILLRPKLTEEEVARFSVNQYRFPGVAVQAEMIRHYPFGPVFAHVVGYVGRIDASEMTKVDPNNYNQNNFVGKTGIEQYYENTLRGTVGYQQVETNAHGQVLQTVTSAAPISGNNLYLTLDAHLQIFIQQTLGHLRGAVVAINPQTGEVLALVSNPSFDPNLFVMGINQKDYLVLQHSPDHPLFNRAIKGQFPPGSTVKPFIGLEGLASHTVTPAYQIYDPGWFRLKNSTHIYHDWQRSGHGEVDLFSAITQSCDTYFYNLADKLGIDKIDVILTAFGLGRATGIDLPGESFGLVASPQWKKKKLKKPWYPGDTLISGIGQGYMLVTPMQLALATAILAMKGQGFVPHLLLKQQTVNGIVLAKLVPLAVSHIQDNDWQLIVNAMEAVAQSPKGTAYFYFRDAAYKVAAKTGTAQVFSLGKNQQDKANLLPEYLRDHSLFIAFAPVGNPKIALAVLVQNSPIHAAEIARRILDFYFNRAD